MRYRELVKRKILAVLEAVELSREFGLQVAGHEKKFTEKQLVKYQAEWEDTIGRVKKKWKLED